MTAWSWLAFDGAKGHAIPTRLAGDLAAEFVLRGRPLSKREDDVREVFFDLPGMVIVTAPKVTVDIDGLGVVMWCDEVGPMLARARRYIDRGPRRFALGDWYYKMHGFSRCIVVDPLQIRDFIAGCAAVADECERRALAFLAEYRKKTDAHVAAVALTKREMS